jgi:hypothetical protein
MYMELANNIADGGDIEFFTGKLLFDKTGKGIDTAQQSLLLAEVELVKLGVAAMGHQNQPGKVSIVHQQQLCLTELAQSVTVGREAWIKVEGRHDQAA